MKKEFAQELAITAEFCRWELSKAAWKVLIKRLESEEEELVEKAVTVCREKTHIDRNPLAAILEQVKLARADRPTPPPSPPPIPRRPKPEWMGK